MASRDELDQLPSAELHDRAVELARERHDLRFLWDLLKSIPSAEASIGNLDYAEEDVSHISGLLTDFAGVREGPIADALRPMYLSYLEEHAHEEDAPEGGTPRA
jgi:hypothetical protein